MQIGIVGLPNAGKSTLFNALTHAHAEVAPRPFTTIKPNDAIAQVPDERLDRVAEMFGQERKVPASIKFVDIAGLVRGAHRGEGLGNQFLGHIREVDAIVHVVRCFSDPTVSHVDGDIDARRDIETVETELALADLATVERRMERAKGRARVHEKGGAEEQAMLKRLSMHLNEGNPARSFALADDSEVQIARELFLLTSRPILYLANMQESRDARTESLTNEVRNWAGSHAGSYLSLPAKLAAEIGELEGEDAATFAQELGLEETALTQLVRASFELLHVITFYTAVGAEASAWVVRHNTPAPAAAGKIHSDIERGFIRAEVISFDQLSKVASWQAARDTGLLEVRGKDYLVRDGDVIQFRFSA